LQEASGSSGWLFLEFNIGVNVFDTAAVMGGCDFNTAHEITAVAFGGDEDEGFAVGDDGLGEEVAASEGTSAAGREDEEGVEGIGR
jgi:hypothetical protein